MAQYRLPTPVTKPKMTQEEFLEYLTNPSVLEILSNLINHFNKPISQTVPEKTIIIDEILDFDQVQKMLQSPKLVDHQQSNYYF